MKNITEFIDLLQPLTARPGSPAPAASKGNGHPAGECVHREGLNGHGLPAISLTSKDAVDASGDEEIRREAAWDAGYQAGQTAARMAMEAEVRADWINEKEALRADLQQVVDGIAAARQRLWANQESEMLALSLEAARQVIKTEITQNPDIVLVTIRNAIRRVTAKDHIRIKVSVSDLPRAVGAHDEFIAILGGIQNLEITDDRRIGSGGCIIQTAAETIDARVDTQIAQVVRALGFSEHE